MGKVRVQGQGSIQANPEAAGARRSASTMRAINFNGLAKLLLNPGPGDPDSIPQVTTIQVDTKQSIFDFCGAMGVVLHIDLFYPSAATIVKLEGLFEVLGEMLKETKDPNHREPLTKARRIMSNFIRSLRNMYFYESTHQEMVIAMNNFFLDVTEKLNVDVTDFIKSAPKGQYSAPKPSSHWSYKS